ncbi:MAG TPA: hypothetical protein VMT67_04315 [Terriglobales bacterium]|nr:hypothetical protein [Terriglobales bacterium]
MKRSLLLVILLCMASLAFSQNRSRQEGTITRMRMTDCIGTQHPLMDALSGSKGIVSGEVCPEYVLVTDSVVYVIVGKGSDQLVPLAETTFFHMQHNELLIRVDDAKHESRFRVKQMLLRPEWERGQQMMEAAASASLHQQVDGVVLVNARQ